VRRHIRVTKDDDGSESVELAILLPVAIIILGLLVAFARITLAADRISGVASVAARDASLARSATDAQRLARIGATSALASADLYCTGIRVDVDTSGFAKLPGTAASVTVDVYCTVRLSDLGVPGMPGSKTLHDVATSPVDPARDIP
jgi:Flp pilus assembly protein TadG